MTCKPLHKRAEGDSILIKIFNLISSGPLWQQLLPHGTIGGRKGFRGKPLALK
jgi:hypothetical protein